MKRLPFFTSSQRRALRALEWVLMLGIIGLSVRSWMRQKTETEGTEKSRDRSSISAERITYAVEEEPIETFPFDPNTADSTTLLRLGLSPWQVRSIYRYRAKHGRYHKPDDFKRLPGLTNEQWERLMPQIRIATEFQYVESEQSYQESVDEMEEIEEKLGMSYAALRDTSYHQEKIHLGQTIDINTADTALLKMIPGIASRRAARIVAYRKTLGGFVSVEQAMEAIEMPDSVMKYMTVSALPVQKININRLSVQQLMKHPYLNFYQAKAINEYRKNKGDLHSFEELSNLEGFRKTDMDRLRPYITFE
ncbi:MAG: helix-hairpin-helix domain-containing protein [Bacteroidaceae bacterium]|nr:helix-hairpin-helix domain-containing protein [Bacteroidaceae bacterium]